MLTQPVGELAPTEAAGGKIKHEAFLIIHPGFDLNAVENEKRLHGCMSYALVTIANGWPVRATSRALPPSH
jgi:hypothetical protein